jgi:TPR repeat protein
MLEEAMLEEAMLEEAGRAEEAIAFYQQAAEAGDTSALSAAARMLEEAGGRPNAM